MPPDRNTAMPSKRLLSGGLDLNMPRFLVGETRRVVDNAVNVELGAFLALLVVPLILIYGTQVDPSLLALTGPLVWVASRSGWQYRRFSIS